jgi:hypothetical protein
MRSDPSSAMRAIGTACVVPNRPAAAAALSHSDQAGSFPNVTVPGAVAKQERTAIPRGTTKKSDPRPARPVLSPELIGMTGFDNELPEVRIACYGTTPRAQTRQTPR